MTYRANAKCSVCEKWMKKTHVRLSEWLEEELEIICDDCVTELEAEPSKFEAMLLAAQEERAERDACFDVGIGY